MKYNEMLKKATDKTQHARHYLSHVFYNAANQEYVATNGHILLTEKAENVFNENTYINPIDNSIKTEKEYNYNYPEYTRVIPTTKTKHVILKMEYCKHKNKKIVKITTHSKMEFLVNESYLKTAMQYTKSIEFYAENPESPLLFKTDDGNNAVVMPMRAGCDYVKLSDIDINDFMKSKKVSAKVKKIFIVIEEDGKATAFTKRCEADSFALSKGVMKIKTAELY